MSKVRLTVIESRCRCGYCKKGDEFIVEDLCPPICHELWNAAYPYIYALSNGGTLDHGDKKLATFEIKCPDESRVVVHGETVIDVTGHPHAQCRRKAAPAIRKPTCCKSESRVRRFQ